MGTLIDIVLPPDQQEGTQSFVGSWLKKIGDKVKQHEPILEITTDKVTLEISAPANGVLKELNKQKGDAVKPGEVLGRIAPLNLAAAETISNDAGTSKSVSASSAGGNGTQEITAAVRRLLKEHNLDPAAVKGTGKGGRITQEDVLAHLEGENKALAPAQSSGLKSKLIPHTAMRRHIASHMVQSLMQVAPHVTTVFECDLSKVIKHRDDSRSEYEKRGAKLTLTSYFIRAAVAALKAVPEVNSRWHTDALEVFEDANIGIATALQDSGLIVPVIHEAQRLDLFGTCQKLQELTDKARRNVLQQHEVQNGTFTISNHGVSGSLFAAPIIINQPQSAILGIGKLERRPAASESGGVQVLPKVYVTLTIDHRVLDGFQANKFLAAFVETLESWQS